MTIVTRSASAQTPFKRYTLTNIVRTPQDAYVVFGMSADRVYLFAKNGGSLYQSSDDGATWAKIYAFPGSNVYAMNETKQGECLVSLKNGAHYRSTGWSTNHLTATWTLVFTTLGQPGQGNWAMKSENFGTNGVIVTNEYGAQTSAGTEAGDAGKARRVWYSADDGLTWKVIFDLSTVGLVQYPIGVHVHSCCYHETDDRIYVTYGDNTGKGQAVGGDNFLQMAFSDDRGTTWQWWPIPTDFFTGMQFVNILVNDANIVLMPDGTPYGINIIPRTGYRTFGQMRNVNSYSPVIPVNCIGQNLFKARTGTDRPIIGTMAWFGNLPAIKNRVMMSADDGTTWAEAYRSTMPQQNSAGMSLYGPTVSGKVVGQENYAEDNTIANPYRFTATLTVLNG
jgi:hypothetical protein